MIFQNRTYERWHLARQAFGGIGGGLVNVVRQVRCAGRSLDLQLPQLSADLCLPCILALA